MNWSTVIAQGYVAPELSCHLIIVGQAKDGKPYCYEGRFQISKVESQQFEVIQTIIAGANPMEQLQHVDFIEFSYREHGILNFAHVNLIRLDNRRNQCVLTLTAPTEIVQFQNRRFTRVNLPVRSPITCRVIGVRKIALQEGTPFNGQLLDISSGGLSFITHHRLFFPLYVELNFQLPETTNMLQAFGEIVRVAHFSSDSYRVAVEFRNTSEQVLKAIDRFCESGGNLN